MSTAFWDKYRPMFSTRRLKDPVVVFMPTYNSAKYLVEAVESIQNQTFADFRLRIMDGGSKDDTVEIAALFAKRDPRIVVSQHVSSPEERLTALLAHDKPDTLFFAHSDDISLPDRFDKQIRFMRDYPQLLLSGGAIHYWMHAKDSLNIPQNHGEHRFPAGVSRVKARSPFWWCVSTPTVVINAKSLRERNISTETGYQVAGDWWIFWQCARLDGVSNLEEVLVSYRQHYESHGNTNFFQIHRETRHIRRRIAMDAGFWEILNTDERRAFLALSVEIENVTRCDPDFIYRPLFDKLKAWNRKARYVPEVEFEALAHDYNRGVYALLLNSNQGEERARRTAMMAYEAALVGFDAVAARAPGGGKEAKGLEAKGFEAKGFDPAYYLGQNPQVHGDPLAHFLSVGWKEGRNPSAAFDAAGYLRANADVLAAGMNPLVHFNQFGRAERRGGWYTANVVETYQDIEGPDEKSPANREAAAIR